MKDRKIYTDEEKLTWWLEKIEALRRDIQIAEIRVEHLKFKIGKKRVQEIENEE